MVGASAGSIPVPAFAGLAADVLPDAQIVAFGDSSGAYPDAPELNVEIGGSWGVLNNVPGWRINDGLTAADWSIPGLTIQSAAEHPDITFARFDFSADDVQAGFLGLAGIPADNLLTKMPNRIETPPRMNARPETITPAREAEPTPRDSA